MASSVEQFASIGGVITVWGETIDDSPAIRHQVMVRVGHVLDGTATFRVPGNRALEYLIDVLEGKNRDTPIGRDLLFFASLHGDWGLRLTVGGYDISTECVIPSAYTPGLLNALKKAKAWTETHPIWSSVGELES